jgi:hypothetical protein
MRETMGKMMKRRMRRRSLMMVSMTSSWETNKTGRPSWAWQSWNARRSLLTDRRSEMLGLRSEPTSSNWFPFLVPRFQHFLLSSFSRQRIRKLLKDKDRQIRQSKSEKTRRGNKDKVSHCLPFEENLVASKQYRAALSDFQAKGAHWEEEEDDREKDSIW